MSGFEVSTLFIVLGILICNILASVKYDRQLNQIEEDAYETRRMLEAMIAAVIENNVDDEDE